MSSRPPIISCVTCGEAFQKQTALKKHRENKHPNGTTFKVREKEYDLIQGVHYGKFMCPICGCPVSGKNNLRRHVIKCEEKYEPDSDMESTSEHSQSDEGGSGEGRITENDCLSLDGLGFHVDHQWKVASCKNCRYIVDPGRIIQHVSKTHKLVIPDIEQARNTIQASGLRPHLAVLSRNSQDDFSSSDDDREARPHDFSTSGFLPGSTPVNHLPIYPGFKCMICLDTCTLKQTSMRSHIFRYHRGFEGKHYAPTSVQAFYDRSALQQQLCYVEVSIADEDKYSAHRQQLSIPANIEQVRGHDMTVERRDRNQFGDKFGAYHLIENVIDFEELKPWFLKPTMKDFQELRRLTVAYLQDCWTHVRAGFQPILAKIMQFDENRQFLHAVQQQQTISNYGEIWAQVLWLACIAVKEYPPSIATGIVLTPEQIQQATRLLRLIENLATDISEEQSKLVMDAIVGLSIAILQQESEVVNFIAENAAGLASQLLVPWAINLLSLRPTGTFVQYGQITHNVAAITYCIRSTFIYSVATRPHAASRTGEAVDNEIHRFLNPAGSTPVHITGAAWGCSGRPGRLFQG
ncbi:hypothetical protein LIPSTDRAFT_31150 [Lipomyces starkeyi NRRL Y-11557]|uniref:C2H2-type domain-containing protein n=1 Tax=Lipomyces starkeyi NRRL Y-11557 TaxID=675824 RepID=A0A1E3PU07_LIPST|nr:hypothetical protein LIPSTDRAFT_31150 [Lipomyces starkeyi NRRL Y-11557]